MEAPPPPLSYIIMLWRRKMGVGWFEAMQMPLSVIMNDLEMMDMEAEFTPKHAIMGSEQG